MSKKRSYSSKPRVDCHAPFAPTGPRSLRCPDCAALRNSPARCGRCRELRLALIKSRAANAKLLARLADQAEAKTLARLDKEMTGEAGA